MQAANRTTVTEILLLGFGDLRSFRIPLFLLFLLIFVVTMAGNALVLLLVTFSHGLHTPMYFFLSQMSLSDIMFTTNITPNVLRLILNEEIKMSVTMCMIQFYLLSVPTAAQCLFLAAMSFDRYVAICRPLHYTTLMTFKIQVDIVIVIWLLAFLMLFILYYFLTMLEFCDSNTVDHFYCDIGPTSVISCSDTTAVDVITTVLCSPIVISPFIFITMTYVYILLTILRIPSNSGRHKAFSTCSSHLLVVCIYYGTLAATYMIPPKEHNKNINKGLSLMYIMVTPLFNPIIYSLRNQDIRRAIQRVIHRLSHT